MLFIKLWRLKPFLSKLISSAQPAFVPGRSILDNVLTAFEMIHGMRRETHGRQGFAALKVDISKAYDKMNWQSLKLLLLKFGFNATRVRWIMMCVEKVKYSVKICGDLVGPIVPKRSLRQGDPLSYLFILCSEGLSTLNERNVSQGKLHGLEYAGVPLVYLIFSSRMIACFSSKHRWKNVKT